MQRWIKRRLPVSLAAFAVALAVTTGAVWAWDAGVTPAEQAAPHQQQAQQGMALTAMEEVENSGYHGTLVLTGTMQGDPQQQQTDAVVSLVHTGGGPIADPGFGAIGHGVLVSGTCTDPVRIVRDLGQLRPVYPEGGFGVGDDEDEVPLTWATIDPVAAGITPMTQGFMVVAVLDDRFDAAILAREELLFDGYDIDAVYDQDGLFDEQVFLDETALGLDVRNALRDSMLACGFVNAQSLVSTGQ